MTKGVIPTEKVMNNDLSAIIPACPCWPPPFIVGTEAHISVVSVSSLLTVSSVGSPSIVVIGQSDRLASTSCLIPMISMIVRLSFVITLPLPEQLVTTARQRQRSVA